MPEWTNSVCSSLLTFQLESICCDHEARSSKLEVRMLLLKNSYFWNVHLRLSPSRWDEHQEPNEDGLKFFLPLIFGSRIEAARSSSFQEHRLVDNKSPDKALFFDWSSSPIPSPSFSASTSKMASFLRNRNFSLRVESTKGLTRSQAMLCNEDLAPVPPNRRVWQFRKWVQSHRLEKEFDSRND